MKKLHLKTMGILFFLLSGIVSAQIPLNFSPKDQVKTVDLIVGNLLKQSLENIHLVKKKIDDDLSEKAFGQYLEKLDYGKQFLTAPDVKELKKYSKQMDDELVSAEFDLIDLSTKLMNKRYNDVKGYVADILKQPFDFSKAVSIETDPKKRKFMNNETELKDLWEKVLRQETLSRFYELKEDREKQIKGIKEEKTAKNKKRKSSTEDLKKKTDIDLEKMAREEITKNYDKFLSRMEKEDRTDKKEKFYNSIARIFDPHTDYLIPDQKADFDIDMSGKLEGIGALLREDGQFIKVQEIIVGSASWKSKQLEPEDTILKVGQAKAEPVEIVGMAIRDAVKMIRGKKGTEVRLTVKKPSGLIKEIAIIRDTVEIEESYVRSSVLTIGKRKVGYVNIPKFYRDFQSRTPRNCTDDTRIELEKLNKENVEALILDLRNNGGGSLEDSRMISGLFIDEGPVVQIKESGGKVTVLEDDEKGVVFKKPVIVLLNAFSASASEIVAGALQDYKRAIIVGGEHSHGKGTVQTVIDLKNFLQSPSQKMDLGALKITVQKFYRVNGISTQYNGITPDIILPDPLDVLDSGEKHLDYSIVSDSIAASKYTAWPNDLNIKMLNENSNKRIKTNPRFAKMMERMTLAKEKKDKTFRSLNIDEYTKDMEQIKKTQDDDKDYPEIKGLSIKTLVSGAKVNKDKIAEYEKGLKKDPYIEETLNIIGDVVK